MRAYLLLMLCLLAGGCQKQTASVSAPPMPTPTPEMRELQISDIVKAFKAAGLPVNQEVVYTDETDPNKLMGRPNQYTAKVNWADTRLKQPDKNNPTGGTVELFKNSEDLEARRKWVETAGKAMPMAVQYQFAHKNALLRLAHELTPKQAAEYEKALKGL